MAKPLVGAAFVFQPQPFVADPRQARLAVAGDEQIDERRDRLGILRARAAGDDQRMLHRAIDAAQRNAAQVEHRQDVAGADFVLQREAEDVELVERRERFEAVERRAGFAQGLLHILRRA